MKIVRAAGPVACHTCMHIILSNAERLIEKSTAEPVVTEGDSFSRLESVIRVELDRFCTYFEGAVDSLHHRLRAVEAKDGDGAHQPSKVSSGSPNDLARVRKGRVLVRRRSTPLRSRRPVRQLPRVWPPS